MTRIFLIGYMGAGKTTLGRALAKEIGIQLNISPNVVDRVLREFNIPIRGVLETARNNIVSEHNIRCVARFKPEVAVIFNKKCRTPKFKKSVILNNDFATCSCKNSTPSCLTESAILYE